MKKILTLAAAVAVSSIASYGQGTIAIYNAATAQYAISTNGASIGAGTGALAGANNYYFALLMTTYGGAVPGNSPTSAAWTFSGAYATNYLNSGGIRAAGAAAGFAQAGWPLADGAYTLSTPEYYMLVGWSANLGTTWAQVSAQASSGVWNAPGYFGYSPVSFQVGGNPAQSLNAVNLLGNPSGINGAGLSTGFQLMATPVPEPTTLALAGLSGASLLLFRRRK